jgi:hypothetical protein
LYRAFPTPVYDRVILCFPTLAAKADTPQGWGTHVGARTSGRSSWPQKQMRGKGETPKTFHDLKNCSNGISL